MSKNDKSQEIKIIYQYEKNIDEEKSLQKLIIKLFNLHINKVIQITNKGK